jgi:hypothetical protein
MTQPSYRTGLEKPSPASLINQINNVSHLGAQGRYSAVGSNTFNARFPLSNRGRKPDRFTMMDPTRHIMRMINNDEGTDKMNILRGKHFRLMGAGRDIRR